MTEKSKTEKLKLPHDKKCPYGFICSNQSIHYIQYSLQNNLEKLEGARCRFHKNCKELVKVLSGSPETIEKYFTELSKMIKKDLQKQQEFDDYKNSDEYLKASDRDRDKWLLLKLDEIAAMYYKRDIWQHESTVSFLKKHGNHQSLDSLGINKQISDIKDSLKHFKSNLKNLEWGYIAPTGATINCNNDPPPKAKYYQLKSKTAQFNSTKDLDKKVKAIYLCKDTLFHNDKVVHARIGIERRDLLLEISSKLEQAATALQEAAEIADVTFDFTERKYTWDFSIRGRDFETLIKEAHKKVAKKSKRSPLD